MEYKKAPLYPYFYSTLHNRLPDLLDGGVALFLGDRDLTYGMTIHRQCNNTGSLGD